MMMQGSAAAKSKGPGGFVIIGADVLHGLLRRSRADDGGKLRTVVGKAFLALLGSCCWGSSGARTRTRTPKGKQRGFISTKCCAGPPLFSLLFPSGCVARSSCDDPQWRNGATVDPTASQMCSTALLRCWMDGWKRTPLWGSTAFRVHDSDFIRTRRVDDAFSTRPAALPKQDSVASVFSSRRAQAPRRRLMAILRRRRHDSQRRGQGVDVSSPETTTTATSLKYLLPPVDRIRSF